MGSNMSSGNIHKLTVLKIKKIRKAGRYSDGNCLYLVIKDTGARQWVLRLVIRGKRHDMGLGSSTLVSLEEARDLARQYRRIAREGGDPLIAHQRDLGLLITERDAAMKVHELNAPSWKNDKHTDQWLTSLELHVFPIIGHLAVCEVTSADILKILAPIWNTKADTV